MSLNVYVLTYNRADLLPETIDSILKQTYPEFSLYILDNCSTDHTAEAVAAIRDERIHYIRQEKNIGGVGNTNFAFDHCDADYFVLFHDDDLMLPDFLEKELSVLENEPQVTAVGANAEKFGAVSVARVFDLNENEKEYYSGEAYIRRYLRTGNTLVYPSVMYRASFIREHSIRARTEPGPCGDIIVLADIERNGGTLCQLGEVLMEYRVHENQDSSRNYLMMHIQLYEYLSSDACYSSIYLSEKETFGEKYEGFSRTLFFRWFHGQADEKETGELFERMRKALLTAKTGFWEKLFHSCRKNKAVYSLVRTVYSAGTAIKGKE